MGIEELVLLDCKQRITGENTQLYFPLHKTRNNPLRVTISLPCPLRATVTGSDIYWSSLRVNRII
ncbi:MAG: hypothetical protein ACTSWN_07785 [Promethearchaeota archaeon]